MKQRIKIICLGLITLVILIGVGFYSWSAYQEYRKEKKYTVCVAWCYYSHPVTSPENTLARQLEIIQLENCYKSCRINSEFLKYLKK